MRKVVGWLDAVFGTIAGLTIQDQEKNEQLNATWLWSLVGIVACLYVKSWELTYTIRPGKKEPVGRESEAHSGFRIFESCHRIEKSASPEGKVQMQCR
jgi:hypothetical protein